MNEKQSHGNLMLIVLVIGRQFIFPPQNRQQIFTSRIVDLI